MTNINKFRTILIKKTTNHTCFGSSIVEKMKNNAKTITSKILIKKAILMFLKSDLFLFCVCVVHILKSVLFYLFAINLLRLCLPRMSYIL